VFKANFNAKPIPQNPDSKLKKDLEPCHGVSCPTPHLRSRNPDKLCECTEAP
jgi:hypothetical protein